MIIESVSLVARPDNRRELELGLSFLLGPIRVEAGCLSCNLFEDVTDLNQFRFECLWDSADDLLRHLRSGVYRQLLILIEMSAAAPSVQFHTISVTQGLEYVEAAREQEGTGASAPRKVARSQEILP